MLAQARHRRASRRENNQWSGIVRLSAADVLEAIAAARRWARMSYRCAWATGEIASTARRIVAATARHGMFMSWPSRETGTETGEGVMLSIGTGGGEAGP